MTRHFGLFIVVVFCLCVSQCHGGCAEVDSMTEAVAGEGFLLGCISCKMREEVTARATVDWYFQPARDGGEEEDEEKVEEEEEEEEEEFRHIFHYDHPNATILHEDFSDRLTWQGTEQEDIQIGAIFLHNVTFNDTGTYRCVFRRTLFYDEVFEKDVIIEKDVELSVVVEANRELTAVVAEIMMYVLIVVLQLWLIVVMVYCYKKISDEHEARTARKALKAQDKAVASKESCDGLQPESPGEENI